MREVLIESGHPRLAEVIEMRGLTSTGKVKSETHSHIGTELAQSKPPSDPSGLTVILVGDKAYVDTLTEVSNRLEQANRYYRDEGFRLNWSVCTNLKDLVTCLKAEKTSYCKVSIVLGGQTSDTVYSQITQELADEVPLAMEYRYLPWVELAIVLLHRACEQNYFWGVTRQVPEVLRREANVVSNPMIFKHVESDVLEEVWRGLNRSIVAAVQSNSSEEGERHGD